MCLNILYNNNNNTFIKIIKSIYFTPDSIKFFEVIEIFSRSLHPKTTPNKKTGSVFEFTKVISSLNHFSVLSVSFWD